MGFDIGALISNLLLSYFSQAKHEGEGGGGGGGGAAYGEWILQLVEELHLQFCSKFTALWSRKRSEQTTTAASAASAASAAVQGEIYRTELFATGG